MGYKEQEIRNKRGKREVDESISCEVFKTMFRFVSFRVETFSIVGTDVSMEMLPASSWLKSV
jgi:hypothetical protein